MAVNVEGSKVVATTQGESLSEKNILSKVFPDIPVVPIREMEEEEMDEQSDPNQYVHEFEDIAT